MNRKAINLIVMLFIILNFYEVQAQPGTIDPTFNPNDRGFGYGEGPDKDVNSIFIQPNGKILILGIFTTYNRYPMNYIGRLDSNGHEDSTFIQVTGSINSIQAVCIQSDSKIIIGGDFSSINGKPLKNIARLNPNGSVDLSFNPGTGANGTIMALATQSDGKIIVGGNFANYNGTNKNNILRLNSNGSIDPTFQSGLGFNGNVTQIIIQSNSKLIISGEFSEYNSISIRRIAQLNPNGTMDGSFSTGTGPNDKILSTAVQNDGKIIIVGMFTSYNGNSTNGIARLKIDGSVDPTFVIGTGFTGNSSPAIVRTVSIQNDGKIIVGGSDIYKYNNHYVRGIVRINSNGSEDSSWGLNFIIYTAIQSDGKIIWSSPNNPPSKKIGRYNQDGSNDIIFNQGTGADKSITALSISSDGNFFIAGTKLSSYNGEYVNNIAHIKADGKIDTTFVSMDTIVFSDIKCLNSLQNGKIIFNGRGELNRHIRCLDISGSIDPTFLSGNIYKPFNYIYVSKNQNDGKIIIGGDFISYNYTQRNCIARLKTDGNIDLLFNVGTGFNNSVGAIQLQQDNKIILGGEFTSFNGININFLARLHENGWLDTTFIKGIGPDGKVNLITPLVKGQLLITGDFGSFNGKIVRKIARLNSDGTLDETFNPGTGTDNTINAVVPQLDGKIIIFGDFTSYNGTSINYLARINTDGSIDDTFKTGTGPDNPINAAAIQSNGKIIIAGSFTSYNGIGRNRVARIFGCSATSSSIAIISCNNYKAPDGTVFTNSGVYSVTIPNFSGCDSTITLNLTINKIDLTIIQNSINLYANASPAQYQWLDCNNKYSPISNAASQSFIAPSNGDYAVQISQNGCIDTTDCYSVTTFSVPNSPSIDGIIVYPNPTSGQVRIDMNSNYKRICVIISDSEGSFIKQLEFENEQIFDITLTECAGIYFITIEAGNKKNRLKLIKY